MKEFEETLCADIRQPRFSDVAFKQIAIVGVRSFEDTDDIDFKRDAYINFLNILCIPFEVDLDKWRGHSMQIDAPFREFMFDVARDAALHAEPFGFEPDRMARGIERYQREYPLEV
ncbi:hypothetical protein [Roseobacter sp. HKCCA0434]|uniref:hypothetical protein n=1 Tax=Roseobacter sp. HKCCA0434 TaxID=3079297 RepID=UPI0029059F61|nr:hypothetical protein [Roseobacter sp. HKCCA0434]